MDNLLYAFRDQYQQLELRVRASIRDSLGDTVVIARVGDELNELSANVERHINLFQDSEAATIRTNILILQSEVMVAYQQSLDASHLGRPIVIERIKTGGRGRPRVTIDPGFLRWAYGHRGTSGIARFLGCSRSVVRNALLDYGIAAPGHRPFPLPPSAVLPPVDDSDMPQLVPIASNQQPSADRDPLDDILQPGPSTPSLHSQSERGNPLHQSAWASLVSDWTDDELDSAILSLRSHYPNAGIRMLDGMLKRLGHRVPQERVRQALIRLDPVGRVFERIKIGRRSYRVPGPNSLWHHDGQHGLIRWGIVIHGFIDGYSRLITALKASNNNRASTVLELFLRGCKAYGQPSRLRGDHGVENLKVAAWMEAHKGVRRGSYIWGRSVHNIRIERLWVDVTAQWGAKWHAFFTDLEIHYGLDAGNPAHLWLLQYLFLHDINQDAAFFAEGWNRHKIHNKGQPARSPADMFGFDMYVHGVRGEELPDSELLEYGVDWEGLNDDELVASSMVNNSRSEGTSSWVGRVGPPPHLNHVPVNAPQSPLSALDCEHLFTYLADILDRTDTDARILRWTHGLAFARQRSDVF